MHAMYFLLEEMQLHVFTFELCPESPDTSSLHSTLKKKKRREAKVPASLYCKTPIFLGLCVQVNLRHD